MQDKTTKYLPLCSSASTNLHLQLFRTHLHLLEKNPPVTNEETNPFMHQPIADNENTNPLRNQLHANEDTNPLRNQPVANEDTNPLRHQSF
jgi:hypothetical protein